MTPCGHRARDLPVQNPCHRWPHIVTCLALVCKAHAPAWAEAGLGVSHTVRCSAPCRGAAASEGGNSGLGGPCATRVVSARPAGACGSDFCRKSSETWERIAPGT